MLGQADPGCLFAWLLEKTRQTGVALRSPNSSLLGDFLYGIGKHTPVCSLVCFSSVSPAESEVSKLSFTAEDN